jgi:ureidoglycolate hydrolase
MEASGKPFHIVVRSEEPTGWRLAVLKVSARSAQRMENHPNSAELFAPMDGAAVLLVAPAGAFDETTVRAFLLDRPICLGPGVWHEVLTLTDQATILIGENLEVTGERAELSRPLGGTLS